MASWSGWTRKRNIDITIKLKQSEEVVRLSGCSRSPERGMEDGAVIQNLTGDRGTARASLTKPVARFAGIDNVGLHKRRSFTLANLIWLTDLVLTDLILSVS